MRDIIKKILKEETSLQSRLQNMIDTKGIDIASTAVGGMKNIAKILNLDLDDVDTQLMLVKNFIEHTKVDEIDVQSVDVRPSVSGKLLTVNFKTDDTAANVTSWYVTVICDYLNKELFPFRVQPSWHPVFAAKGTKIFLDAKVVDEDMETDEEEELREEVGLIDRLRKLFPKKELTTEEKRIELIVRYLIPMFKLQSHKNTNSEGHKTISVISFNNDGNSTVMKYYPEFKRLEYTWGFAEKIHKMFPHKDLLDLNSEMIGQLFTKLYKKKVDRVERYRYLS
jgi:hypothetical protein